MPSTFPFSIEWQRSSSLAQLTTTNTIAYTSTGSTIGCMEYKTVVTRFEVRERWLEQIISGVMTYITQIYRVIFEIKVDPTVDQTIVVLSPTCTTTTTPTTATTAIRYPVGPRVGGIILPVNTYEVLAPYLLLLLLGAVLIDLGRRSRGKHIYN